MAETNINWGAKDDLDCIVICGGLGTRMLPMTFDRQKTVLAVESRPVLSYIVDYWRKRCSRFFFVAHYKAEQVEAFVRTLDVPCELIIEEKAEGIARALAKTREKVGKNFVTVLGDCLCNGQFHFPANMEQGVGVTGVLNPLAIHQSYAVRHKNDRILEVIEKPKKLINNDCGMGVYFFSREVFDHIDATHPSPRTGRVEITDVIQHMVAAGRPINRILFIGDYVNITYPEDLMLAGRIAERMNHRDATEEIPSFAFPAAVGGAIQSSNRIDRLLLFRTVPMGMFQQVVRFVRSSIPVARLEVLCQAQAAGAVSGIDGVDGVQLFPTEGLFRLSQSSGHLIRQLRRRKYNMAVVPYNNPNRTGYLDLELLAKLTTRQTYGLVPPAQMFILSWLNVARMRRLGILRSAERCVYWGLRSGLHLRRTLHRGLRANVEAYR
jgi:dTDP-glucose pyrophosphorylase